MGKIGVCVCVCIDKLRYNLFEGQFGIIIKNFNAYLHLSSHSNTVQSNSILKPAMSYGYTHENIKICDNSDFCNNKKLETIKM